MQLIGATSEPNGSSMAIQVAANRPAIAIIGIGCRLPGDIASPSQLWDFLAQERSAAGPVPASRFNNDAYTGGKDEPSTSRGPGGYFLKDDIRQFDNHFFGINNREAADMDPQQRKLLEVVFECFESAGYSLDQISGAQVGCYVASFVLDYIALQSKDPESMTRYSQTGMGTTILANRISHAFNLKGPSCVIDTACSSSIYALHQACSALQNGECESAVVGGVSLIQSPDMHVAISQAGVLSASSVCHTFDVSADGYGRADGVNAVYIKLLDDAIRDGDPIRSIVRGTAVNSNGRTPGISQPSIEGQISVSRKAYHQAGLSPADTAYVEMHGTGTAVGDVMEVESVAGVFSRELRRSPIMVGGLKPNLGHGEASSGLTSVIKATLALERRELPPTIGVINQNPKLQLEERGIRLIQTATPFPKPSPETSRRISINSFGYGGANSHAILEEAGTLDSTAASCSIEDCSESGSNPLASSRPYLLPFSANNSYSLEQRVEKLAQIEPQAGATADLAYTLGERRSHFKDRGFMIVRPKTLAQDLAIANLRLPSPAGPSLTASQKFGFVFTGQGAQWQGMAQDLLQVPLFANVISQMERQLETLSHPPSWKISNVLRHELNDSAINQAVFAQPITTAVQIALIEVLRRLRIPIDGVVGHSSGEIAAAYAADLLDMREAIILACYRGYAVTECAPRGAMAAVGLGPDAAEDWIHKSTSGKNRIRVACINSPESVTISGDSDGIDALISALAAEGIFARKLKTDGKAYHSHQMAVVGAVYEDLLQGAAIFSESESSSGTNKQKACMYSTVLRQELQGSEVRNTAYWRRNLESPVHFSDGLLGLSGLLGDCSFVEVGPHTALKMPILQTLGKSTSYFGTLKRGQDSLSALLELVGSLFTSGFSVDFSRVRILYPTTHRPLKILHDLPPYPWHYETVLWNESRASREGRLRKYPRHELLGSAVPGGNLVTMGWRNQLQLDNVPWLRDHQLGDTAVFPAAGYLAMAVEALLQAHETDMGKPLTEHTVTIQHVDLPKALPLADQESIELYTELCPREISNMAMSQSWWDFQIVSIIENTPTIRARGSVKLETTSAIFEQCLTPRSECQLVSKGDRIWYDAIQNSGLRYGPTFQHMQDILTPEVPGVQYAEAKVKSVWPKMKGAQPSPRYLLHPTILDNILQAGLVASAGGRLESMVAKVPTHFDRISLRQPLSSNERSTICCKSSVTGFSTNWLNATLLDSNQQPVAHFEGFNITTYAGGERMEEARHPIFRVAWKPDIDNISDEEAFSAALQYVRMKTDLGRLTGRNSDILLAMDLAVHKYPNADILFLSRDTSLAALALLEVLEALSVHRRFNSFHLGRFSATGQLEVAELQNYSVPFGLNSISFVAANPDQKFGLVILGEGVASFHHLAPYTEPDTRIIAPSGADGEVEKFTTIHDLSGQSTSGVRIYRPVQQTNGHVSQQFDNVILISRSSTHKDDDRLQDLLSARLALPVERHQLTELGNVIFSKSTLVLSTVELERAVVAQATVQEYAGVQHILAQALQVVWITGSGLHESSDPTRAVFPGLARAVMIEQPSTKIFSLELDPRVSPTEITTFVAQVIEQFKKPMPDYEYLQGDSGLLVSRILPDDRMNDHFRNKDQGLAVQTTLSKAGPVSLSIEKPGQLSTVQFVKAPKQSLGPQDVLVKVSWIGLNAKDVYALAGRVETPDAVCSAEYTGKVLAIGSAVRDLAVNDNVAVLYPGHFSSHETVPSYACVKLRPEESLRSTASIFVIFATALYALENRAHLQAGESVLIHSAAGGVGIAAIQIAKLMGAEIFATVGTEEKKQFLVDNYGLRPDHIYSSRDCGFAAQIRTLTNGRGVDVILNSLVGDLLFESWNCLAEFGRFVEIGKKDIKEHGRLPMDPFNRGATFTAFDLDLLARSQSSTVQRLFQQLLARIMALLRSGAIQPVNPLKSFTVADLGAAFRYFNNPARMGKIVISFEDPTLTIPVVPERYATQLSPNKSYLMVGCLGGLGRSLSQWMVDRGARNFIFLGRSGTQKPAARHLIEGLERKGARCIVVQGDVTNIADVEKAVMAAPLPLGGVIHAAMGLHEALFSDMTHEFWRTGTKAKVQGAWNLHTVLSQDDRGRDLDFFVLTSSINGKMGTATESNYCAANNFLDAFARYRRTLGRPAISLGLGAIAEVGYLHENPHIEELLLRKGLRFLSENDMLQIVDLGLSQPPTSTHASDSVTQSLLLTGVEVTSLRRNHQQGYGGYWHFLDDPRFSVLASALKRSSGSISAESGSTHVSELRTALALKDEVQVNSTIQDIITQKLSNLVFLPLDKINVQAPLSQFGMDSMLAAELRQYIFTVAKADVPFLTLMDPQTSISSLSATISSFLLQE